MKFFSVVLAILCCALPARAQEAQETTSWLRASELTGTEAESDKVDGYRLEIAAQRFEHPDDGTAVTLVGVVHIGDQAYYDALQAYLKQFDCVLFESVAPTAGTVCDSDDPDERVAHTQAALELLGGAIRTHHFRNGRELPASLEQLAEASAARDSRMPQWLAVASRDAWGSEILFEVERADDEASRGDAWSLRSLGPDGVVSADDLMHSSESRDPRPRDGRGLQAQLATALGLAFQLEALDYNDDRFVLADMTVRQLDASAKAKGADMGPLLGSLSGSSLPARAVRAVLLLVRLADLVSGNQVRDIIKVVLIETLSNPEALEQAQQEGAGMPGLGKMMEIILDERNDVALDILDRTLAAEQARDIALLYGAAHNPGLAIGLQERGFEAVGEPVWFSGIEVDLQGSNLDPSTVEQVRRTMESSLGSPRRRPSKEETPTTNGSVE